ncbi:hypothetical protein FNF28_05866 [Cafeteria roenbergensis]|uniref:FG-GAP repeat-containing protein n=1 Tax=Cafeteria roenbergensis TaxID=33653 RepID=A0A5A8D1Z6_CAFRO|nr:hypothetical protein FNF28_05866 [Cafeteria roenbergensis]
MFAPSSRKRGALQRSAHCFKSVAYSSDLPGSCPAEDGVGTAFLSRATPGPELLGFRVAAASASSLGTIHQVEGNVTAAAPPQVTLHGQLAGSSSSFGESVAIVGSLAQNDSVLIAVGEPSGGGGASLVHLVRMDNDGDISTVAVLNGSALAAAGELLSNDSSTFGASLATGCSLEAPQDGLALLLVGIPSARAMVMYVLNATHELSHAVIDSRFGAVAGVNGSIGESIACMRSPGLGERPAIALTSSSATRTRALVLPYSATFAGSVLSVSLDDQMIDPLVAEGEDLESILNGQDIRATVLGDADGNGVDDIAFLGRTTGDRVVSAVAYLNSSWSAFRVVAENSTATLAAAPKSVVASGPIVGADAVQDWLVVADEGLTAVRSPDGQAPSSGFGMVGLEDQLKGIVGLSQVTTDLQSVALVSGNATVGGGQLPASVAAAVRLSALPSPGTVLALCAAAPSQNGVLHVLVTGPLDATPIVAVGSSQASYLDLADRRLWSKSHALSADNARAELGFVVAHMESLHAMQPDLAGGRVSAMLQPKASPPTLMVCARRLQSVSNLSKVNQFSFFGGEAFSQVSALAAASASLDSDQSKNDFLVCAWNATVNGSRTGTCAVGLAGANGRILGSAAEVSSFAPLQTLLSEGSRFGAAAAPIRLEVPSQVFAVSSMPAGAPGSIFLLRMVAGGNGEVESASQLSPSSHAAMAGVASADSRFGCSLAAAGLHAWPAQVLLVGSSGHGVAGSVFVLATTSDAVVSSALEVTPASLGGDAASLLGSGAAFGAAVAQVPALSNDAAVGVAVGAPGIAFGQAAGAGEGYVVLARIGPPPGSAVELIQVLGPSVSAPGFDAILAPNGSAFGSQLAALGDINGDGFDDLAVGAPLATAQNQVQVLFLAPADAAELSVLRGHSSDHEMSAEVNTSSLTAMAWVEQPEPAGATPYGFLLLGRTSAPGEDNVLSASAQSDAVFPTATPSPSPSAIPSPEWRADSSVELRAPSTNFNLTSAVNSFGASVAVIGDLASNEHIVLAVGAPESTANSTGEVVVAMLNSTFNLVSAYRLSDTASLSLVAGDHFGAAMVTGFSTGAECGAGLLVSASSRSSWAESAGSLFFAQLCPNGTTRTLVEATDAASYFASMPPNPSGRMGAEYLFQAGSSHVVALGAPEQGDGGVAVVKLSLDAGSGAAVITEYSMYAASTWESRSVSGFGVALAALASTSASSKLLVAGGTSTLQLFELSLVHATKTWSTQALDLPAQLAAMDNGQVGLAGVGDQNGDGTADAVIGVTGCCANAGGVAIVFLALCSLRVSFSHFNVNAKHHANVDTNAQRDVQRDSDSERHGNGNKHSNKLGNSDGHAVKLGNSDGHAVKLGNSDGHAVKLIDTDSDANSLCNTKPIPCSGSDLQPPHCRWACFVGWLARAARWRNGWVVHGWAS